MFRIKSKPRGKTRTNMFKSLSGGARRLQRGRKTPALTAAEKRPAFLQRVSLCTGHVEKRTAETPSSTAKNALKNASKNCWGRFSRNALATFLSVFGVVYNAQGCPAATRCAEKRPRRRNAQKRVTTRCKRATGQALSNPSPRTLRRPRSTRPTENCRPARFDLSGADGRRLCTPHVWPVVQRHIHVQDEAMCCRTLYLHIKFVNIVYSHTQLEPFHQYFYIASRQRPGSSSAVAKIAPLPCVVSLHINTHLAFGALAFFAPAPPRPSRSVDTAVRLIGPDTSTEPAANCEGAAPSP
jgi:hypothetical protein